MSKTKTFLFVLVSFLIISCSEKPAPDAEPKNKEQTHMKTDAELPPFAVGSTTLFIHDETRPYDSVAGVNEGIRTLITEIWYPVNKSDVTAESKLATYGDYVFGDVDVHKKMMTQTTFFHLTPDTVNRGVTQETIDDAIAELFDRPRGSYLNLPLSDQQSRFPVVVMTHGDAGSRYNMQTACETLASHGYVVIAPEHTGNSPYSQSMQDPAFENEDFKKRMSEVVKHFNADGTYGSVEKYGQTYTPLISNREDPQAMVKLDNSLLQRVNDLRATLRKLDELNQSGQFEQRLDLDQIGLMGRSFGGTTTLAALALEPRFTAGVSVVPLLMPDVRPSLPEALLKPIGSESVLLNTEGAPALAQLNKPTMLLSGAEDGLIIGVGVAMAQAMGSDLPSPSNPLPPLRAAYEASNSPVFWGLLNDSNHSSFGVSGGYWWPELKPNTQARYFDPEQTFTVIKPTLAHQIQGEKVLQFFDAILLNKADAAEKLKANQFSNDGLIFESRNF